MLHFIVFPIVLTEIFTVCYHIEISARFEENINYGRELKRIESNLSGVYMIQFLEQYTLLI